MPRLRLAVFAIVTILLAAAPRLAWGNACVWTGTTSNAWATVTNWSSCAGLTPQPADSASIPSVATQPTLSTTESITAFSVSSGATLTIAAAGSLSISGASSVDGTLLTSGAVQGPGSISFLGGGVSTLTGTYAIGGATTIGGSTVNFNQASTVAFGSVAVSNGGSWQGSANFSVSGTLTVSSGTIGGSGTLTLLAGATGNLTDPNGAKILNRNVVNAGTLNFAGATVTGTGTITNNALANASGVVIVPAFVNSAGATFNQNAGTTTVNPGSGSFANAGTVNVNAGTLQLSNGGTSTGAFGIASGATLQFDGGTFGLASASLAGAGNVTFSSGSVTLAGVYSVGGTTTLNGGTAAFNQATTLAFGNVAVSNGSSWQGSANFTVSGTLTLAGTIGGSGTLTLLAGATGNLTDPNGGKILNRNLVNAGTMNFAGATVTGTGTITNNALANASAVVIAPSFINSAGATFNQNAGTTTVNPGSGSFANTGTVSVNAGTLQLSNGGTSTGAFGIASGATLQFDGGTFGLASASLVGAGNVTFSSGSTTLAGVYSVGGTTTLNGGTATFNQATTLAFGSVAVSNGSSWQGSANFTVTGTLTLAGTIGGSGTLTLLAGATGNLTDPNGGKILNRNLVNAGTMNLAGATVTGTGTITNNALANASGVVIVPAFVNSAGATFNQNAGTTTVNPGSGSFANAGTVSVNAGTLQLSNGGTSAGAFGVASGATLQFDGGTFGLASASLTGAGNVTFSSGSVTLAGVYSVGGTTTLNGGSVSFNQAATVAFGNVALSNGGSWQGSANFSVSGTLTVNSGSIGGAGTLTVLPAAVANLATTFGASINRGFVNDGTLNFGVGVASGSSTITNHAIANASAGDIRLPFTNSPGATFNQNAGTTTDTEPFANAGTVNLNAGALQLFGSYTQTAGTTRLQGGAIIAPGSGLGIQGGSLSGSGSVSGPVNVSGTGVLSPGSSPGTIASGNYNQSAGSFNVELNGPTTPGSDYDQLAVTGSVALGGALGVSLGFAPTIGQTFVVLANDLADPIGGTFGNPNPFTAGGVSFGIGYAAGSGNDVVLTVVRVPSNMAAPASTANPSVFGQTVTFSVSISGNGPTPTGSVQFFDGATPLGGPVVLDAAGSASSGGISSLAVGTHGITAQYSGDTNFFPSTSTVRSQVVNKASTTSAAVSSVSPSAFGQSVQFGATVAVVAPGAGTPTGSVVFNDGGVALGGPVSLVSGQAAFSSSSLLPGSHSITAVYGGDATHDGSTSPAVNQMVSPAADVVLEQSVTDDNPTAGTNVTFTLSATNAGPSDASGVLVSDVLPAGLAFVSAAPSGSTTYVPATGVWNVGALTNGGSATLQLVATATRAGAISNRAVRTAASPVDPQSGGGSAVASLDPGGASPSVTDLSLEVSADNPAPAAGTSVTFTLLLRNQGPATATAIQVIDTLPAGYVHLGNDGGGAYDSATGIWSPGSLTAGAGATLHITAGVSVAATRVNSATIVSLSPLDTNPFNDQASVTLNGPTTADVRVAKAASSPSPNLGQAVTFTLLATNHGRATATSLVVTDVLPSGLTFVSANPAAAYDNLTGAWTIGTLAAGSSATLQITAVPTQTGTIANTATRTAAGTTDPNTANDSGTATLGVPPAAGLSIGSNSPGAVEHGTNVAYVLTVTNAGPDAAQDVAVQDPTPTGTTFVAADPGAGGSCTTPPVGGTGLVSCTWSGATSNSAGNARVLGLTVKVDLGVPSGASITNSAAVSSPTFDPDVTDNTVVTNTGVTPVELLRFEIE